MFIKNYKNMLKQVLQQQSNTKSEIKKINLEHQKMKQEFDDSWDEREKKFKNYSK